MELVVFSLELHYIQLLIGNEKFEKKKKYTIVFHGPSNLN